MTEVGTTVVKLVETPDLKGNFSLKDLFVLNYYEENFSCGNSRFFNSI